MSYPMLRAWRKIQRGFYRAFPSIERAHLTRYAAKAYDYSEQEMRDLWDWQVRHFEPGKRGFLNMDKTIASEFFFTLASRELNEADEYQCFMGVCTVYWNKRLRKVVSSMGPAGCACAEADDPRGKLVSAT